MDGLLRLPVGPIAEEVEEDGSFRTAASTAPSTAPKSAIREDKAAAARGREHGEHGGDGRRREQEDRDGEEQQRSRLRRDVGAGVENTTPNMKTPAAPLLVRKEGPRQTGGEPAAFQQGARIQKNAVAGPAAGKDEHGHHAYGSPAADGDAVSSSLAAEEVPPRSNNIHTNNASIAGAGAGGGGGSGEDKWSKLHNLAALYEQGFILEEEYRERRSQLIDELTGTTSSSYSTTSTSNAAARSKPRAKRRKSRVSSSIVVPRPPPDFGQIPTEEAVKHYFSLESRSWKSEPVTVRLDDTPFARGGLRLVYHLQEVGPDGREQPPPLMTFTPEDLLAAHRQAGMAAAASAAAAAAAAAAVSAKTSSAEQSAAEQSAQDTVARINSNAANAKRSSYVAKIAINPSEDPSTYFRDVEMQAHCAHYARLFNSYNPPRLVEFCKAWILELTEREGAPLCAVERFVAGDYRKFNNNYGYVSEDERNTPQAFSHFTYEASARTMLVVDIQGVGDLYTDPQIHTLNGRDFGKGNLGIRGFDKFLSTHRCNQICRYLKLPPVNPNYNDLDGTMPALPFMPATRINKHHFKEPHYYEESPALRKYLASNPFARKKHRRRHNDGGFGSDDDDDEEDDSFLRQWATRDTVEAPCNFMASCALL
ncbi:Alpha-protein kinase 1 [Hondaea fermentalgiana]|uniref:Alpha-protein kinase 1 n=1 Tax=Hondaea fermentalgiana TaxID=2315210 RepID=A0A2R5GBH7_9STRA|nr:Alpha-protein kinase 1 [Hondaea fermentalgiana]|eukprot:GBG28347.1 Alpha-protein kinase 1 [Hondaea fermentalgiana]